MPKDSLASPSGARLLRDLVSKNGRSGRQAQPPMRDFRRLSEPNCAAQPANGRGVRATGRCTAPGRARFSAGLRRGRTTARGRPRGRIALCPLFGGHSSSNTFELSVAGSNSPATAKAVTCLPPGCTISPRLRNLVGPLIGRRPSSSVNSRMATASGSSPSSYSPLGIDQAPSSLFAQSGPPGCTSRSSHDCGEPRCIKIPALRLAIVRP